MSAVSPLRNGRRVARLSLPKKAPAVTSHWPEPSPGFSYRLKCASVQAIVLGAVAILGLASTPPASATPASALAQAITSARASTPCGPLRYDPLVERAAATVNRSTKAYLDHTADNIPADDTRPIAITADLGLGGEKVYSLQGAGSTDNDAVKGLLIQGYNIIPDCDYRDFGVSLLREESAGFSLAVAVLVGH